MSKALPKISIITVTLNSERTIREYFRSIINQRYPLKNIEILLIDGGSTDNTLLIAKEYARQINVKIIKSTIKENQEARRLIGFQKSSGAILCVLDSDNYIWDRNWLKRLVLPMIENPQIVGSFTLHYEYNSEQTLFNRYVGLYGVLDSVVPYLKKNDRQKITTKFWPNKRQIVKSLKDYTILKFDKYDFPTLGGNGFLIRKKYIDVNSYETDEFFHIDILYDLVSKDLNQYAVVNTSVLHDTAATVGKLISKRVEYMSLHHKKLSTKRRYKVFDSSNKTDQLNLIKYIIFTLTVVEPLYQAVRGYLKYRDMAWFFHPISCWIFLVAYGLAIVKSK